MADLLAQRALDAVRPERVLQRCLALLRLPLLLLVLAPISSGTFWYRGEEEIAC
jgi:hypothetical protein